MFGSARAPQNENTPFQPRSPYAAAKVYAYWMVRNYREGYKLFGCNGILFNHESPRRGETFVTRKITRGIAQILAKKETSIYLGNLSAKRDWGYAPEYVEVMWQMLQQDTPDDYVIGTGEAHSVDEFVDEAFRYVNIDRHEHVVIEPKYFRPTEVPELRADAGKAQKRLDWIPKITFNDLVKIMVDADLEMLGLDPPGHGKRIALEKGFQWAVQGLCS
jgi:GDPmannose 4,6-dehydratase